MATPKKKPLFKFGKSKGFFGVHWAQGGCSPSAKAFVRECCAWVERPDNVREEGIYRKSGELTKIHKLQAQADKCPRVLLDEKTVAGLDVHVVTGVLKLYLRLMPEPLIPFDLYGPCIAASGSPGEIRDSMIANVVSLLPPANKAILSTICYHLQEVSLQAERNLMNTKNLAIVFAPNILRAREETADTMIGDSAYAHALTVSLIAAPEMYFVESAVPRAVAPRDAPTAPAAPVAEEPSFVPPLGMQALLAQDVRAAIQQPGARASLRSVSVRESQPPPRQPPPPPARSASAPRAPPPRTPADKPAHALPPTPSAQRPPDGADRRAPQSDRALAPSLPPPRAPPRVPPSDSDSDRLSAVLADLEKAMRTSLVSAGEVVVALKRREMELASAKEALTQRLRTTPAESHDAARLEQGLQLVAARMRDNSAELEIAKEKYRTIRAKLQEMSTKRERLSAARPRSYSVLPRPAVPEPPSAGDADTDAGSDDAPEELDLQLFEQAFERLWNGLIVHSGPSLLEEGLRRGQISRGFWLVEFPSAVALIRAWRDGLGLSIKYIGGGAAAANHHSAGNEEFVKLVSTYNLENQVCFILVAAMPDGLLASSWGTVDRAPSS